MAVIKTIEEYQAGGTAKDHPSPAASLQKRFCVSCGAEGNPTDKFCASCGNKLG